MSEIARKMRSQGLLVFRTKLARERFNNKELPPIHLIVFIWDKPVFVRIAKQKLMANKFQVKQVPELPGDYVILDPSVFGLERFFEYVGRVHRERRAVDRVILESLASKSKLTPRDAMEIAEKIKEDGVEELKKMGLI
ncbi:MAG: hypothetical protein JHC26_09875 [Thermofilum sp.]|uniref:hypothetical protein n=1 Tax=Thermofilum sp. TaxID=1961369 RepID=UPI0025902F04|nr:hypothetical protein [Thermofilum sp.]MCI4409390.1 hypothetical protein [Thermofilum sp.]